MAELEAWYWQVVAILYLLGTPVAWLIDWMELWLPPTLTPLELAWTTPAAIGLIRYVPRWWRSRQVRTALTADDPEEVHIVQDSRVFRYLCLTVVFECFFLLGLMAATLPQGPATDTNTAYAFLTTALLFVPQFVLLLKGEIVDREENRLAGVVARKMRESARHENRADRLQGENDSLHRQVCS